jgi:16S rRNA processing protein RimM
MLDQAEEQVLIGVIKRAHGIKGEVILESHTFDTSRFAKHKKITLQLLKGEMRTLTVSGSREAAQGIIIKFEEIPDRNAAELLQGAMIYIPLSERLPLPENKMYYDEITGMKIIDNESGETLGIVRGVQQIPSGDIYILEMNDGSEKLITSAGEEIIKLNKKKKEIRVKLLEEY